jgi:hypothetical protein
MSEICQRKEGECRELLFLMPRLCFLVLETLVDNRLTIRSRVVSLFKATRVAFVNQLARRKMQTDKYVILVKSV